MFLARLFGVPAVAVVAVVALAAPASAIPIGGLSLTVDPRCFTDTECFVVTAELTGVFTSSNTQPSGEMACSVVAPGAVATSITCVYNGPHGPVTASPLVASLPIANAAARTVNSVYDGTLCVSVSLRWTTVVRTYSNCYVVYGLGQ